MTEGNDECAGCGEKLEHHASGFGHCNHKCTSAASKKRDAVMVQERRLKHQTEGRTFSDRLGDGFLMLQGAYQ